jgi:hypothetical protein
LKDPQGNNTCSNVAGSSTGSFASFSDVLSIKSNFQVSLLICQHPSPNVMTGIEARKMLPKARDLFLDLRVIELL